MTASDYLVVERLEAKVEELRAEVERLRAAIDHALCFQMNGNAEQLLRRALENKP